MTLLRQLERKVIGDETDDTCGDVGDGLFAVTGDGRTQEIGTSPSEGSHRMDAAVRSPLSAEFLRRRAPGGEWAIALRPSSSFRAAWLLRRIYQERMITHAAVSHGGGVLDPVDGSTTSRAGRLVCRFGNCYGQRLGPPLGIRSIAANSKGIILFANVQWEAFRVPWMAEELAAHHRYQQRCS